jgi:hypothetical protein
MQTLHHAEQSGWRGIINLPIDNIRIRLTSTWPLVYNFFPLHRRAMPYPDADSVQLECRRTLAVPANSLNASAGAKPFVDGGLNASWRCFASGGTGAPASLSVNPSTLAIGAYTAVVTFLPTGAILSIPVVLSVMPPAPGFSVPRHPRRLLHSILSVPWLHIAAAELDDIVYPGQQSTASAQARLSAFGDPAGA